MTNQPTNILQRTATFALGSAAALSFLAPLLTRLVLGIAFYGTGHGKLMNFDRTASFFADLGIPFATANAAFVSTLELVGGVCLILGFGTRIFSVLLSSTMVVALLTADKQSFVEKFPGDLTDVTPFVFLLFLTWLALYGPGSVSLDCLLSRLFRIKTNAPGLTEPALAGR